MRSFDQTHLTFLILTVVFYAVTMFAAHKLSRKGQNIMFAIGAVLCAGGIFFRYGMGLKFSADLDLFTLATQQLQVCNFNFVLVLLMLIPKCELARQYSIMFSMFAACTYMFSLPTSFADNNWYDATVLNSWLNHTFAIALPLWMLAAGRLKPQKKYILPVTACVAVYFIAVYGCTEWLHTTGKLAETTTFSFVYSPDGVGLLEWLYKLIPMPFFYLVPLALPMLGFFWLLTRIFRNYSVRPFAQKSKV